MLNSYRELKKIQQRARPPRPLPKQLLYPVLMIFMACRTIALRVRPNELLVFRLSDNGISQHSHHHDETKGNDNEDLTQAENGRGAPPEPESDGTAWAQRGDAQEILEEPERRCVWGKVCWRQQKLGET